MLNIGSINFCSLDFAVLVMTDDTTKDETQSLLGAPATLGMRGFRAPWLEHVCPRRIPYCVFNLIEGFVGNAAAHEFLLLMIASDRAMLYNVLNVDRAPLPGTFMTRVPSFQYIRNILAHGYNSERTIGMEGLIENYTSLMTNQVRRVPRPPPPPVAVPRPPPPPVVVPLRESAPRASESERHERNTG